MIISWIIRQWPLSYRILHKQVLRAIVVQSMDTDEHFCADNKLKVYDLEIYIRNVAPFCFETSQASNK